MKRIISIALVALVGIVNGEGLRLGDYCAANQACNSGCCWQGVCRSSYSDCSSENQIDLQQDYMRAMNDQFSSALSQKIVSFVQAQREQEPLQQRLKSFFKADMKKKLGLQAEDTPADPAPAEPATPVDPAPVDPAPVEPATPVDPAPVDPAPVDPVTPAEPATPVDPAPVDPVTPAEPATPVDPAPVDPAPVDPVTPAEPETPVTPDIEGEEQKNKEDDKIDEQLDASDDGVSAWVWILVFLGTLAIGAAGFFVVKRLFFKNDTDYAAAQAVTA